MFQRGKFVATLAIILNISLISSTAFAYSGVGTGTTSSPYMITDCTQLQAMTDDLSATYMLANDVDCTGVNFARIGTESGNSFTGTFSGNGYIISHLYLGTVDSNGLFGFTENATLRDFTISDSYVGDSNYAWNAVGLAVGQAYSTHINNIIVENSTAVADSYIGGIVGALIDSTLTNSSARNVTITSVGSSSSNYTGGAVGYAEHSTIDNAWSSGNVTASQSGSIIGGLVGGTVLTPLQNSYSMATVNGYRLVGGLVGSSGDGSIHNVYSTGNVTGQALVGGLVGSWSYHGVLDHSFSTGRVIGDTEVGGLVGRTTGSSGDILDSFFDEYRSEQTDCVGVLNATIECAAVNSGNTTPNYFFGTSTIAPFSSWNFTSIWKTVPGSYPVLSSVPNAPTPITVTPTTSSLTIHWSAPDNGGSPVTNYRLSYSKSGSAERTVIDAINPSAFSYVLDELDLATSYDIQLQALNAIGNGKWSNFSATTSSLPDITPISNPSILNVAANVAPTIYPHIYENIPTSQDDTSMQTALSEQNDGLIANDTPDTKNSSSATQVKKSKDPASASGITYFWWLPILATLALAIAIGWYIYRRKIRTRNS